ncbi:MAG TPA: hypothetical protein DHW02_16390 [Ktedonobacter sp.]|nr:hypothetical protein [Ktedonobacter sp.]
MRPTDYSSNGSRALRIISLLIFFLLLVTPVIIVQGYVHAYAPLQTSQTTASLHVPDDIALDTHLPVQSVAHQSSFTNVNATFGSRFNFSVNPATESVETGTDGIFHENAASYVVGIAPKGEHQTLLFHMGHLNNQQGDSYLANETWTQGLTTTRWQGDALNEDMHVVVNIISPFQGEPACTVITSCPHAVADDTLPLLIIGIRLQNMSAISHTGAFLFGSNRATTPDSCSQEQTNAGTSVTLFSYASTADATGGTLFLAGNQHTWACQTSLPDRAGLAWNYTLPAGQSRTAYMLIGGWNASQNLFVNTQLPTGCQNEALYATHEWSSEQSVVNFALDNLSSGDNLLGQAQQMENQLITNNILSPEQRWMLGETLRSYKANSWLLVHPCANDGSAVPYDAAVYEGTYGLLSTVDVMHDYGYFEITHVPWFFRAEMTTVLQNATTNTNGTYFQHDQGGDTTSDGSCTSPGSGVPTIRATCYAPPYITSGTPMPTEENADVVLLLTYYTVATGDHSLATQHLDVLNATMEHNLLVGNPQTGIAYAGQDTATTYDAASDCLHNVGTDAGNQYYLGLKEAAAYRATSYLNTIVSHNANNSYSTIWSSAATKIEDAMVQEYNSHGFLPLADSTAFSNCDGRSITLGEGLFYLHLSGLDQTMNQTLLSDLSSQYLTDLSQSTLASSTIPGIVTMTSTVATGSQCKTGHCRRYEWFSKAVLSSLVADIVYTQHGCMNCARLDLSQAAYAHNLDLKSNFSDGIRSDTSDWDGHLYPRGIICWAYLSSLY